MAVFSRNSRSGSRSSQRSNHNSTAPKLYVLASRPASDQDTEWFLEVDSLSSATMSKAPGVDNTVQGQRHRHGLFSSLKHRKASNSSAKVHNATEPSLSSSGTTLCNPTSETIFISLASGSHDRTPLLPNTILRISTPLGPEYPSDSSFRSTTNISLPDHIKEVIRTAMPRSSSERADTLRAGSQTGMDLGSARLLRDALFALQSAHILPGPEEGFDVEKFVYFATSSLEHCCREQQQQQQCSRQETESERINSDRPKMTELDYAQFLEDNAALRRRMEDRGSESRIDQDEHGEDGAHGSMHIKQKRLPGGFWITYGGHGNDAHRRSRAEEDDGDDGDGVLRTRNPYGGLM